MYLTLQFEVSIGSSGRGTAVSRALALSPAAPSYFPNDSSALDVCLFSAPCMPGPLPPPFAPSRITLAPAMPLGKMFAHFYASRDNYRMIHFSTSFYSSIMQINQSTFYIYVNDCVMGIPAVNDLRCTNQLRPRRQTGRPFYRWRLHHSLEPRVGCTELSR